MNVYCLHLTSANIASFQAAAPPEMHLTHFLHADILRRAKLGFQETAQEQIALRLAQMTRSADAALLTCSTLSGLVATPGQTSADHLIADSLAGLSGTLDVLFADPAALENLRAVYALDGRPGETRFLLMAGVLQTTVAGDAQAQTAAVDASVGQSTADHVLVLQAPLLAGPPDDPRAIWAPQRALSCLAQRLGCSATGVDPLTPS